MEKESDYFLIEKASVLTWDGDLLCLLSREDNERDLPITIENTKGNMIRIPNDEIPKFCKALMMIHTE